MRLPALCSLALLAVCCSAPAAAESFEARVISILAGDTIEVMRDKRPAQVTLYGVDAPEVNQPFGKDAVEFLAELTFNKPVKVDVRGRDALGRLVGIVTLTKDRKVVNETIIREGMAWWSSLSAARETGYKKLEESARTEGRGLWSAKDPIAPWDWRDGKRPARPAEQGAVEAAASPSES